MASAIEIRERLRNWLDGEISLHQFEDWFVPSTWNVHREYDREVESLVDEIELNLSEYSGGHSTIGQLRQTLQELAHYVRPYVVVYVRGTQEFRRADSIDEPVLGSSVPVKNIARVPSLSEVSSETHYFWGRVGVPA